MTDDAQARAKARLGSVLDDKWTLERLLGIGGMAAVYAGRHRNGARGAIKILHPELARVPELKERFLREGYLANKVEHPGALKVLDDDIAKTGADAGAAYIVMELLEGESVDAKMQRLQSTLPEDEVLGIAEDVLAPLISAHEKGIVHRDIKPENLFIAKETDADGKESTRTKILDFGLARMEMGMATRAGLALGTPSFMAPEQAAGKSEEIDARTDIFGLGATMWRCLTAARIHEGANSAEIVSKMATIPAPSIKTVRADLSDDVAAIVDRALQFRREDRYANAAAMREDVQKARATRAISLARQKIGNEPTLHDGSPTAGVASVSTSASAPAITTPPENTPIPLTEPARRWRAPIGFAVFWVVAVVAVATVFFMIRARLATTSSTTSEAASANATESPSQTAEPQPANGATTTATATASATIGATPPPVASTAAPAASTSSSATVDTEEPVEELDTDAGTLGGDAAAGADGASAPKIAATPKPPVKKPATGKPQPWKKKKKWK